LHWIFASFGFRPSSFVLPFSPNGAAIKAERDGHQARIAASLSPNWTLVRAERQRQTSLMDLRLSRWTTKGDCFRVQIALCGRTSRQHSLTDD